MQYSPKLKKAMSEMQAVADKYDIAAIIVLHTPGHSEYLMKLDPSYSCARILPNCQGLGFHTKGLPPEKQQQLCRDTANMLHLLSLSTGNLAVRVLESSEFFDRSIGAHHFGNGHTSQQQQDN